MTREEIAMVAAREARIVRSPVGGCPVLRFEDEPECWRIADNVIDLDSRRHVPAARDDIRSEMWQAWVLAGIGVGLLLSVVVWVARGMW